MLNFATTPMLPTNTIQMQTFAYLNINVSIKTMYQTIFQQQEATFKTLANQKRLEIVQLLTNGELPVQAMADMLGISQTNVSQHLAVLRRSGIVATRRDGHEIYYQLKDHRIAQACRLVRAFLLEHHHLDSDVLDADKEALYPLAIDPVCGMRLAMTEVADSYQHKGEEYYFCASGCMQQFSNSPEKYLTATTAKE